MTESKEHVEKVFSDFIDGSWRVALAEDRYNDDEKIYYSGDCSPSAAAERFAYDYFDDSNSEFPDIGETVHVAVWVDGKPKCFEVRVIWATEADECDWPNDE